VSQCASAQVGVDGSRICLEKLSGCVDGLIIWLSLNCCKDWVREACHDVLDGGVLHLDVLGGPECLFALLEKKRFWSGGQKKPVFLLAGYIVG
jgi:hypothetical protein